MRISDWSSDVCSSDLGQRPGGRGRHRMDGLPGDERNRDDDRIDRCRPGEDRKSVVEGKRVSVRVDLGGRRIMTKKTQKIPHNNKEILEQKPYYVNLYSSK